MNFALTVAEFYKHNKDINIPTYLAFLGVKICFNVVVHPNLMRKLYYSGIKDHEWLLKSLQENSKTKVKGQGQLSPTFTNQQGICQGDVFSADLYKLYNNKLLNRIQRSKKTANTGNIPIQAPACADDVTLLGNDPDSLQFLTGLWKNSSDMDGYIIQESKRVILKMNSFRKYSDGESWSLGTEAMPIVKSTTLMGILRTSSNQEIQAVESNIQKARRTVHSLMVSGLRGENGQEKAYQFNYKQVLD